MPTSCATSSARAARGRNSMRPRARRRLLPRRRDLMTPRRALVWTAVGWLAFAVVMGVNYFFLLSACGVFVAPERSWFRQWVPAACSLAVRTDALERERARNQTLEHRLREIELDAGRVQGACAPQQRP